MVHKVQHSFFLLFSSWIWQKLKWTKCKSAVPETRPLLFVWTRMRKKSCRVSPGLNRNELHRYTHLYSGMMDLFNNCSLLFASFPCRCDISVCYKPDSSTDWRRRRSQTSAQIQPLNPTFCSLLCLPIFTFGGALPWSLWLLVCTFEDHIKSYSFDITLHYIHNFF